LIRQHVVCFRVERIGVRVDERQVARRNRLSCAGGQALEEQPFNRPGPALTSPGRSLHASQHKPARAPAEPHSYRRASIAIVGLFATAETCANVFRPLRKADRPG
jgi:hypothetical protein